MKKIFDGIEEFGVLMIVGPALILVGHGLTRVLVALMR